MLVVKRYGQQLITLKDMVIEHLMERMETGATITELRKALGGSTHALTRLMEAMVTAGEAIKLAPDLEGFERVPSNPDWLVKANVVADGMKDLLEDAQEVELDLDAESIARDKRKLTARWSINQAIEHYKLSPRMWIEEVAGI